MDGWPSGDVQYSIAGALHGPTLQRYEQHRTDEARTIKAAYSGTARRRRTSFATDGGAPADTVPTERQRPSQYGLSLQARPTNGDPWTGHEKSSDTAATSEQYKRLTHCSLPHTSCEGENVYPRVHGGVLVLLNLKWMHGSRKEESGVVGHNMRLDRSKQRSTGQRPEFAPPVSYFAPCPYAWLWLRASILLSRRLQKVGKSATISHTQPAGIGKCCCSPPKPRLG